MFALGVDVDAELFRKWRGWAMPERQPYTVPRETAARLGLADEPGLLTEELRDTFLLYGIGGDALVWLRHGEAGRVLPEPVRRAQPGRHRWPSRDDAATVRRLVRLVENGRPPSVHREVPAGVWREVRGLLPGAEALAGRFTERSGPNCFGAVMGAAGVPGAMDDLMGREPFEDWLSARTRPSRRGPAHDADPGTVLVWRRPDTTAEHAALTLGAGFALHKFSRGWMSPTVVLPTPTLLRTTRFPGWHLHRYRLH